MADVLFSFDPACEWTWRASRWLTEVAASRCLQIDWQSFSLLVHYADAVPENYRCILEASHGALRLVEALRAAGRTLDIARLYTELGTATHEAGHDLTRVVVRRAVEAADLTGCIAAVDDPSWDAAVRESHAAAFASAGPDVGSPVIRLPGSARGLFGPVLSRTPSGREAEELWDAVSALLRSDVFYELKRGRPQA